MNSPRSLTALMCAVFAILACPARPASPGLEVLRDGRGRTIAVKNTAARAPQETFFASMLAGPATEPAPAAMIASAGAILAPLAAHFGVASGDLLPQGAAMDSLRMNHVHYVQRHHGVPVFGSELIVHLNPGGEFSTVNGRTLEIQDGDVAIVPGLSVDAASAAAWNAAMKRDDYMHELVESTGAPKLWIYNEGFVNNSAKSASHLVWEVTLAAGKHAGGSFFIEADKDARLIKYMSAIHGLNRKVFDCGDPRGDATCYMNWYSSDYPDYYFGRSEGQPVRGPNPVPGMFFGSNDVDTLYDYVPIIGAYYLSKFGRNYGNDHGGTGDGTTVPFGDTRIFCNEHSDPPNSSLSAAWNLNFDHGMVSDDVFGHEYGHVVSRTKNFNADGTFHRLLYQGESGALNESSSDIFGEAFEYYRTGSNDWIVGTGAVVYRLRSLADPPSGGNPLYSNYAHQYDHDPDRYLSPDFYRGDTSFDNGGNHHNSGVPNKAAYLTAVGGTFNGRTITGLGITKVEQIWYRALTTYYADSETFNGAYVALRQACADLYPAADVAELTKALQAVEMDQPPLPAPPFVITTVTRPAPAFTASVTWNSHAGQTYGVQYSTDLVTWTDLNAAVPAHGERTIYTDTVAAPTTSTLFYRVQQK